LFHSIHHLPPGSLHPVLAFIQTLANHGWLGVHVFFALSGWCITERLATACRRGESLLFFLRERFLRIYPAYWAALLIAILLRLAAAPINHTSLASNIPASPLSWFGDLTLLHFALGTPVFLLVSWTLFCEMGFYGAAGLALGLFRLGVRHSLLLPTGALFCFWSLFNLHHRAFLPLELWPEFYAGVIAWWAARGQRSRAFWASLTLFVVSCLLTPGRLGDLGIITSSITAVVLFFFAQNPVVSPPSLLIRCAYFGAMSYSIYLIHVPILSPLINLSARLLPTNSKRFVAAWALSVAVTFLAGWLFYRFIEKPCEQWRRQRYSSRKVLI
jgi:peptidoglycan/LPS O-acetylase OafA/YrhL